MMMKSVGRPGQYSHHRVGPSLSTLMTQTIRIPMLMMLWMIFSIILEESLIGLILIIKDPASGKATQGAHCLQNSFITDHGRLALLEVGMKARRS